MIIRSILSIALLASLTACSFGKGEGAKDQEERIRREQREAQGKVEQIAGQWVGTLNRAGQSIPMMMTVRAKSVETGRTANGTPIVRYDTQAAISSTAGRTYSANFTGSFDPATGDVVLTNAAAKDPDDLQGLRLVYNGTSLAGALDAVQYTLGSIEFVRSDAGSGNDGRDEEDRQNELERQLFKRLTGFYYGEVTANTGTCLQYNVCLQIYIEEQPTPRGGFKPLLKAQYYREDVGAGSTLDKILAVAYNYRSIPQTVVMTSQGIPQPFPGTYTVQINGQFGIDQQRNPVLSTINGNHLSVNQGIQGRFQAQKVQICPGRPSEGLCNRCSTTDGVGCHQRSDPGQKPPGNKPPTQKPPRRP